MIWVPSELAEILRWKLGHFDKGIKLSPEAKALLELNEAEALQVKDTIDDFVRGIRDIEQRNSTLLEKTPHLVTVSLPAGLTPNGPFQELEAELLPLLGPVKFRSVYVQLTASLRQSSAIMSGRKMILTAKLLEEGKIHIRMEMQGGANTTTTSIPMNLWHLLPPIVGTGRNRSWR